MKTTGLLQVFFGGVACADAYFLTDYKAGVSEPINAGGGPFVVNTAPPDATLELILLVSGILVLGCALWQSKAHTWLAVWQIIFGAVLTLAGVFFSIRALFIGHFEISVYYYFIFFPMAAGAGAVIIGLFQSFGEKKHRKYT